MKTKSYMGSIDVPNVQLVEQLNLFRRKLNIYCIHPNIIMKLIICIRRRSNSVIAGGQE